MENHAISDFAACGAFKVSFCFCTLHMVLEQLVQRVL
jgi:hypothetical protein